ncbi:MAG: exodeoxyribonuclease VII large subunit, partial [Leptothrix sp. (in: Bacteria)]|nr:exodeoxyribonuclease VII large subunit [Leptothrix sp. (in: b-proteobacteria)]
MSEPDVASPARLPWGVAALLLATADALAARFGAVAVRGELSGFSRAGSGHCYFALKDIDGAPALLRCALFRRAATLVNFAPSDGQQVEVRGRLGIYEARGELQMVVESLQRLGTGTLYEEFLRRRARLEAQGLFDAARKRPLPAFPAAVGVITSLGAAALHDVLTTLQRRAPQLRVVVYPSAVQGAEAPAALAAALRLAGARAEVDTLLLVRGGGSLEDLWAFNDERVVQAVAASPLPVVCGVGHETDFTLCDLAADLRAPTPTAAAELAAPSRDEALAAVKANELSLRRALERALQARAQRLDTLALRLGQPARGLLGQSQRLHELAGRLARAVAARRERLAETPQRQGDRLARALAARLQAERLRLEAASQHLMAHDPQRVLKRGYAWVEGPDGRAIVSATALRVGQSVRGVWADGRAEMQVQQVEALPPTAVKAAAYNRDCSAHITPIKRNHTMEHTLPALPYAIDALAPHYSKETLEFHHGKHHNAYVVNLNNLQKGTEFETLSLEDIIKKSSGGIYNNSAQIWNHTFFWNCMKPAGGGEPGGALAAAINAKWGSYAAFREAFVKSAVGNFGSGWTW